MEISLTPALTEFVNGKLKEGRYESASEIVRQALRNFEMADRRSAVTSTALSFQSSIALELLAHTALDQATSTLAQLDIAKEFAKDKLDSQSEIGEMESLRLQMAMDRMSKLMSTLSNLLKKVSETANEITQNIK
jgi:antitoxin ParD1/3/4